MKKLMKKVVPAIALAGMMFSSLQVSAAWQQSANGNWWNTNSSAQGYSTEWEKVDGQWYYFGSDGWMRTGWVFDNETWFYLNSNGAMATGWNYVNGAWYYMHGNGAMATGWAKVGNQWYYLNGNGAMATGWVLSNDKWYYMDGSGAMTTGWQNVNGTWYFMDGSGAMMKSAWIGGNYYVGENGAMVTNAYVGNYYVGHDGKWIPGFPAGTWKQDANGWWFLTSEGKYIASSWAQINGSWYYFDARGYIYMNQWKDNCYLGATGAMATSSWVDGNRFYVNYNGEWIPNYGENYFPNGEYKVGADLTAGTYTLKPDAAESLAVVIKSKDQQFTETRELMELLEKTNLTEAEKAHAQELLTKLVEEGYVQLATKEIPGSIALVDGDFVFVDGGYLSK